MLKDLGILILKYRKISLLICGIIGVAFSCLFSLLSYLLSCYFPDTFLESSPQLKSHLTILFLGLPTFFLLWFFRTSDTRESLNSSNFFGALNLLGGAVDTQKRYGLVQLLDLKKKGIYEKQVNSIVNNLSLNQTDLKKMRLKKADLRGANLQGADLEGVDLEEADLRWSSLSGANLKGANLQGADLEGALLIETDLQGANLGGTDLSLTKFIRSDLRRVALHKAKIGGTQFTGSDLKGVVLRVAIFVDRFTVKGTGEIGEYSYSGGNSYKGSCDLVGAKLQGANLQGIDLQKVDLARAQYNDKTLFPEDFDPKKFKMIKMKMR